MPVHDLTTLVSAGEFHDFHFVWIAAIRAALNEKLLPADYYAVAEGRVMGYEPDVVLLSQPRSSVSTPDPQGVATTATVEPLHLNEVTPRTRYYSEAVNWHPLRQSRVAIHTRSRDRAVALIELISPANKDRPKHIEQFNEKLESALLHECNLFVVDFLPPGKFDPHGMHASFWSQFADDAPELSGDECLGVASYHSPMNNGLLDPTAYYETFATGQLVPDMPLFLRGDEYVNIPMQAIYDEAISSLPARWKTVLEAPKTP